MSDLNMTWDQQPQSVLEAARLYVAQGWEPLPLPFMEKSPKGKWKEPRTWSEPVLNAAFRQPANIGIALGDRSSGLVDIDFDCPEAAKLAEVLLPRLPVFGRQSNPSSHRIVHCVLSKRAVKFQLPPGEAIKLGLDRSMLLEVRGSGHQTMFPPSIHPGGEEVKWQTGFAPLPAMGEADLLRACGLIAALSAVARAYPRVAGERDEVALILAGVLVRCGLPDELVDALVIEVARLASDDEADMRGGKAAGSRAKVEAGEHVWGMPELCKRLGLENVEDRLRGWLELEKRKRGGGAPSADGHPLIIVRPGNLPAEVDQAEAALIAAGLGVYQRGESLVRVVRLAQSEGEIGIRRPSGALSIINVVQAWLKEKLALAAVWQRVGPNGELIFTNAPAEHATTLLARVGEWRAPVLNGVVASPTMRKDGTILQALGYDKPSGLLYDPGGTTFPEVPLEPTREEAAAALEVLAHPFREFPFATPADRSVLLAAVLTALIRPNLDAAPLVALDAPTAGSGKSLLAETVGIIATGHKPTMISQGKTPEEDEKRLASVLMAGDAVVAFDNCERPLQGDTLCTVLTQEYFTARILGRSEVVRLPTNALIMATGNNLEVEGDVGRGTLVCRLDAGAERPDQREYDFDPRNEAMEDRAQLVVAGLTILRAFIAAGRPRQKPPMGSFEAWNIVRDALIWLGQPDPVTTRDRIMADDPQRGELAELLALWVDAVGADAVTLSEISARERGRGGGKLKKLVRVLASYTERGLWNVRSIGRYLSKQKDRVVDGKVLKAIDSSTGVKRYRVVDLGSKEPDDGDNSHADSIPF